MIVTHLIADGAGSSSLVFPGGILASVYGRYLQEYDDLCFWANSSQWPSLLRPCLLVRMGKFAWLSNLVVENVLRPDPVISVCCGG